MVLRLLTPACALLAAAVSQAQDYYNAAERRAATFSMFHGAPSGTDLSYYGDDYYQIIKTSNQTAAGFSGNSVVRGKNTENPALTAVSDYRRRFRSVNNPGIPDDGYPSVPVMTIRQKRRQVPGKRIQFPLVAEKPKLQKRTDHPQNTGTVL